MTPSPQTNSECQSNPVARLNATWSREQQDNLEQPPDNQQQSMPLLETNKSTANGKQCNQGDVQAANDVTVDVEDDDKLDVTEGPGFERESIPIDECGPPGPVPLSVGSRHKLMIASVLTVLLYICFLAACVMTSVESVKSVIKASTTPVSSTSIKFQSGKYSPPAIVLLYVANSNETSTSMNHYNCVCRYSNNGGLSDIFTRTILGEFTRPKRKCKYVADIITIDDFYHIAIESNHSLISVKEKRENGSKVHEKHYIAFTVKGPEDWQQKEQVEIACFHKQTTGQLLNGHDVPKTSIEYMILPSYEKLAKHENRMKEILTHRGTKKTEMTEQSISKTLHIYLMLSEVEEQGKRDYLLDTEESYKIVPGKDGGAGSVKLKFEWKSPMVWKIKSFIASSPWYAVTVICTMLLTLAEAINVSRKIKVLFMGGTITTAQVELGTPLLAKKIMNRSKASLSSDGASCHRNPYNEDGFMIRKSSLDSRDPDNRYGEKARRPSYVAMMNTLLG